MSVKIKSTGVSVSEVFCDKITLLVNLPQDKDYGYVYQQLNILTLDHEYGHSKDRPGWACSKHLYTDQHGHLKPHQRRAMMFQLKSEISFNAYVRMEFNPAKDDMAMVRELVEYVTGYGWEKIMEWARVTRCDMTVDVAGIDINTMAASCKHMKKRNTYTNTKAEIESIYFGSRFSRWRLMVYDKAKQSKTTGKMTRIEASYHPKSSEPFKYLAEVENPFSRLTFYGMAPLLLNKPVAQFDRFFIKVAKHEGLKSALDCCEPNIRKKMQVRLDKYINDWFSPDQIWLNWKNVINLLANPPPSIGFID